jgi:hypothetical protein
MLAGTGDKIAWAHNRASDAAMGDLELFASTPVWEGAIPFLEVTGNVVAAAFDCSFSYLDAEILQSRYLLFNLTFQESEERWAFMDAAEMLAELPHANDSYLSYLAAELKNLGYDLTEERLQRFEASEWGLIEHLN